MLAFSHPALSLLHMLPQSVLAASQRAVRALHQLQVQQRCRQSRELGKFRRSSRNCQPEC